MRDRLEFVNPFLDEDLVGACYQIPRHWLRKSVAYRTLFLQVPKLARIRWEKLARGQSLPRRPPARLRQYRSWYRVGQPISFTHHSAHQGAFMVS